MSEEKRNKDIYKMDLHEIIWLDHVEILRVNGGWIYTTYDNASDTLGGSAFVPFIGSAK